MMGRMVTRKIVGLVLALALIPCFSFWAAGQQVKTSRIGFLLYSPAPSYAGRLAEYRQALADLGWVQGRNLVIEQRSAENHNERLPELAADLVRAGVSVLVAENASATRAAMQATRTIPIVMAGVGDPVRYGLIASLAQPGGNVTGLSFLISEMMLKNLELLKEVAPRTARVALLANPSNPGVAPTMADLQRAAPALGISVIQVDVLTPEDFERAFATIVRERADGVLVTPEQLIFSQRHRIATFAEKHRLPSAYASLRFMDAGGLMALAPTTVGVSRRLASYVDRLLRGAKAADLPVEQPTKFELVINLKTAKALGLTIPPSLLQRADRVIE
jgi:putative tryptophan/tyrosine transport system substrate-binding protein